MDLWISEYKNLKNNELSILHLVEGHTDLTELVKKHPKDNEGMSWTNPQKRQIKNCIPCKFNKFKMGSYRQLPHTSNTKEYGTTVHIDQTTIHYGTK